MLSMFIIISTFILISEVKSDQLRPTKWWTMNGTIIKMPLTEYCKNKNCIVKCCPDGRSMAKNPNGAGVLCIKNEINNTVFNNYTEWDKGSSQMNNNMTKTSYFDFIQSNFYSHPCNGLDICEMNQGISIRKFFPSSGKGKSILLQNGSIITPNGRMNRLEYCLDFLVINSHNYLAFGKHKKSYHYPVAELLFIASGMLISSVFMILVLFVYAVLPSLQNIVGMVLIAYLLSLTGMYTLRGLNLIAQTYNSAINCHILDPVIYFCFLSSFFWLNVMAIDLWWTLRGSRKCRDIHRRGERVKFLTYTVYGWGFPALMTLILVILDQTNAIVDSRFKPPFGICLNENLSTRIYLYLPIGIITAINCILFALTVYNIWLIRKSIDKSKDSSNTNNNENRFKIYLKLFVLMGVTWILEQIPSISLAWDIALNSVNWFVGVIIFYIFVCKKSTIVMLCKRFKIRNKYLDKFQSSNYSKTENTSVHIKSHSSRKSRERTELSTYSIKE